MLISDQPEEIGLSASRLQRVYDLLDNCVGQEMITGSAISVARGGIALQAQGFGRMGPQADAQPIQPNTVFLVASVTKPVTAAAAMLLVERGKICLDDLVISIVPEFGSKGKEKITIRHLLTHTPGLPDMLPENEELRAKHAPLSEFVRRICDCELLFDPGTNVSYQSMGIAMLGEIVERFEGMPLRDFMQRELFKPLGMNDTFLGIQQELLDRVARVNVPETTDWHWNSPYWRNFGAPWGGMFSTVRDMTVFCQMFLNGGELGDVRIFSPATVTAMTSNQIIPMPDIPQRVKFTDAWGLGWQLKPANNSLPFGDLVSPESYGHLGATGTMVWVDPSLETICVLFTNQPNPLDGRLFSLCSNAVAAAVE